jgi:molybdopterin-guanine dinucleotide biosynthesis protein A
MTATASSFSAAVLAGGHSRRMGTDKAHLPHPRSGRPLLLHQLELLASLNPTQRLVSARHDQELPDLPDDVIRVDDDGTAGPLAGIITALEACTTSHLLIIPVDLPNLTVDVLQTLLDAIRPGHGVYAVSPNGPEPLLAVIPDNLLSKLGTALTRGNNAPHRLWQASLANYMRPVTFSTRTPFHNWNTP